MPEFPKNFFWGAATSAYQVEGNNYRCDWWEWEKSAAGRPLSGQACRHYELYKEDFDLAKGLFHNCHRFSIEWSRIEPEENKFSSLELEHYRKVLLALRERQIEPVVTLHHFTNPLWFARSGGWANKKAKFYFLRYVDYVVRALSDKVRFWVTINEPMVYMYFSYITGEWPPQEKSYALAKSVTDNLAESHIAAYKLIRSIYQKNNQAAPSISIAHNLISFVPCKPTLRNKLAVYLRNRLFNLAIIERLIRAKSLDYLGINYYTRHLVDTKKWNPDELLHNLCRIHQTNPKNSIGWEIYPQGLYDLLLLLKRFKLPVFILENGVSTSDDNLRWEFIREHLKSVQRAMSEGVNILGYIYWSLFDNFEWDKGFTPRFGLIEIDYANFQRRIRASANKFAQACKTNILN